MPIARLLVRCGWPGLGDFATRDSISELLGLATKPMRPGTYVAWVECGKSLVAAAILSVYRPVSA